MKLYKHTLISAALVLIGSAQAQTATCPIGMGLVYTALTHIPFCVGVPSNVRGTGSSSGSSSSSSSSSAANFSAGLAAEDYIPVRPLDVTGISPAAPGLLFTNEQFASYLRDNNLTGAAAQKAADVFGISPVQLSESMALLAAVNAGTISGRGLNTAHFAYQDSATPQQRQQNIDWETDQGLHPELQASLAARRAQNTGATQAVTQATLFSNEQVASYMRDNNLTGAAAQKAADVFGISPVQLSESMALLAATYAGTISAEGINAAQNAYYSTLTPKLQQNNIAWETAQGLHSEPAVPTIASISVTASSIVVTGTDLEKVTSLSYTPPSPNPKIKSPVTITLTQRLSQSSTQVVFPYAHITETDLENSSSPWNVVLGSQTGNSSLFVWLGKAREISGNTVTGISTQPYRIPDSGLGPVIDKKISDTTAQIMPGGAWAAFLEKNGPTQTAFSLGVPLYVFAAAQAAVFMATRSPAVVKLMDEQKAAYNSLYGTGK